MISVTIMVILVNIFTSLLSRRWNHYYYTCIWHYNDNDKCSLLLMIYRFSSCFVSRYMCIELHMVRRLLDCFCCNFFCHINHSLCICTFVDTCSLFICQINKAKGFICWSFLNYLFGVRTISTTTKCVRLTIIIIALLSMFTLPWIYVFDYMLNGESMKNTAEW